MSSSLFQPGETENRLAATNAPITRPFRSGTANPIKIVAGRIPVRPGKNPEGPAVPLTNLTAGRHRTALEIRIESPNILVFHPPLFQNDSLFFFFLPKKTPQIENTEHSKNLIFATSLQALPLFSSLSFKRNPLFRSVSLEVLHSSHRKTSSKLHSCPHNATKEGWSPDVSPSDLFSPPHWFDHYCACWLLRGR